MKAPAFFGVIVVTARFGFFTVLVILSILSAPVESLRKIISEQFPMATIGFLSYQKILSSVSRENRVICVIYKRDFYSFRVISCMFFQLIIAVRLCTVQNA